MINIEQLYEKKTKQEKITCLTVYDASFADVLASCGVDVLLVGDSLGMVVQGQETTLPVTVDEMIYHAAAVKRGAPRSFIVVDMPFLSCANQSDALQNAGKILKHSGANMVKIEGGHNVLPMVKALVEYGIPVCGHLGLLPQSVHKTSGYKVQGKTEEQAEKLLQDAKALESAGIDLLVLECIPAALANTISQAVAVPTIGIGAGVNCDGQVLVLYDMLGISKGKRPRFSKNFLVGKESIADAVNAYIEEVKNKKFPGAEHSF